MQRYSKQLREQVLMTRKEVAEAATVNILTLGRIENGKQALSDQMNVRLLRVILPKLQEANPVIGSYDHESNDDSVREIETPYGATKNDLASQVYQQFSEAAKQTITLEQLRQMIKNSDY
ncbi:MAG: helix-turn-helix domain-containing protein [Culicoidibacterales bacterium]